MPPTDENIITELRSLRPTPSERFSAELDAWAAAGFPPADRGRGRRDDSSALEAPSGSWLSRIGDRIGALRLRPLPLLGGAVATLFVVVVAATALSSALRDEGAELSSGGDESAAPQLQPDSGGSGAAGYGAGPAERATGEEIAPVDGDSSVAAPEPTTVPPSPPIPGPPSEKLRPGQDRVQERSASMTLSTEPGEVDDVADEVVDVVDRYAGIVVSSQVSTGGEKGRATLDLRIPTANLQAALADLSDLASVSSRDEGTLDITAPFVTAEERFRDAKAEVDALLEELAEADSSTEIASLRKQLRIARGELAAARDELGGLKQRADFSRVSLTVLGDGDADGWSLGDAVDDARSVLEDLAGAGLVTLAVLVPLGAIALAGWFGIAAIRRRRRERSLDR